jgi:hypothetical protein
MFRGSSSKVSALVAISLVSGLSVLPSSAFGGLSGTSGQKYKPTKPPSDKPTFEFMERVGKHPELMNLPFLAYTLGRPTPDVKNGASPTRRYYWTL